MIFKAVLIAAGMLSVGSSAFAHANAAPPAKVTEKLKTLLDAFPATTPHIKSSSVYIATPKWRWSSAIGMADGKSRQMTAKHVFRVDGLTTLYIAAATLRLMEMGKLDIDKPIADYLPPDSVALLKSRGYVPEEITIQHLLSNTSGLPEFTEVPGYEEALFSDPARIWSRKDIITFTLQKGTKVDVPGSTYSDSLIGFVLLSEIVERQTGNSIAQSVRDLLRFKKLGLRETYWEGVETKPGRAPLAASFLGARDVATLDQSSSYNGGGGIITNVEELGRFARALVRGDLFAKRSTLATMMAIRPAKLPGSARTPLPNIGGLNEVRFNREDCYGTGGYFGQDVLYCPKSDVTFAWTINQLEYNVSADRKFRADVASVVVP
jgi:D-alanyl-D-alanine carboxypeptidase